MSAIALHEILSLHDPVLPAWLDLYQTAFHVREQLLVSSIWRNLADAAAGSARDSLLVAALDPERPPDDSFVGLAWYALHAAGFQRPAYAALWYLAARPRDRGAGYGSAILQEVMRRAAAAGAVALFWEVERPDDPPGGTPEDGALAERRIRFYHRHGALLMHGIEYVQSVEWQPPVRMRLMVKLLRQGLTVRETFRLGRDEFGFLDTGEESLSDGGGA